MSETQPNQEQNEAPVTTTIGGQVIEKHEDGSTTETVFPVTTSEDRPASDSESQTTSDETTTEIGGQTIEKNEDGTTTTTVFPVTSETEPAPEPQPEETSDAHSNTPTPSAIAEQPVEETSEVPAEETAATEPVAEPQPEIVATEATPVVAAELPSVTIAPTKESETETVAEVGIPKEVPNQAEAMPAKVGVFGSVAILGAAAIRKVLPHKK